LKKKLKEQKETNAHACTRNGRILNRMTERSERNEELRALNKKQTKEKANGILGNSFGDVQKA
jgi:2,3-bisphosphoglycerate-independent phosphoglycerate mutase